MQSKKKLWGKDLEWCARYEGLLETLRVLNILGAALTKQGAEEKRKLEKYIEENGNRYLELTRS